MRQQQEAPAFGPATGSAQLVLVREFPDYADLCASEPGSTKPDSVAVLPESSLFARFVPRSVYASQDGGQTTDVARPPVRTIRDTYPTYSFVAVDPVRGEVVLQDNNLWSISVFNRMENTSAGALAKPKRLIKGPKTDIQFNNGVYIDPKNGDIYSVESDTGDKVVVFGVDANGDVEPKRILNTPHRGFALDVDEEKQELYVSVQYPPQVAVYRKDASGDDKPLRSLQGESTRLSDTHGVAIDVKNRLMYVNNWGHVSDYLTAGTGRMEDASIAVFPLEANGDASPVRVIQGPRTQLNWPGSISIDPVNQELYVANDVGHSILVFSATDQGNVAPRRVIKGSKTGLLNPTGVSLDLKNKELWASNFGNSTATVYPLNASGDVAPLRTIRSAPAGRIGLKFGKVEAIAYDSKRQEYLVPN